MNGILGDSRARRPAWLGAILLLVTCEGWAASPDGAPPVRSLLPRIEHALSKVRARELRSDMHTPWVVAHAVIAFENDVRVLDVQTGERVEGIEYLLTRARYDGKRIFRDAGGEPDLPTRSLSFGMTQSHRIQDHVDQFLMAFADAGVGLDRRIVAEGGVAFRVGDLLAASLRNFHGKQELGWTLVAMSTYLKPGERWVTSRGETGGIEDVLALAIERDPVRETEGGPHHLYGIAFAVGRHEAVGGEIRGVWAAARAYLQRYVDRTRSWQQESGAFSAAGFRRNRAPGSPRQLLSTTGHALEWLSIALPARELKEPWVRRAVDRLCSTLLEQPLDRFSDGGLYHAAHALRLYREAVR